MSDLELENEKIVRSSVEKLVSESKKKQEQGMGTIQAYSGPIPPPQFLAQYELLVPGIAKKFLEEPHIEAEHRRVLEKMIGQEQIKLAKRGQLMAFSLAICCILGAFWTIFSGHSIEGLGALLFSIAAFTGIFIYAKKRQ